MSKVDDNILTVFDVGSAKTCVLVLDLSEGGFQYRGHGIRESRGIRKGQILTSKKRHCRSRKRWTTQRALPRCRSSAAWLEWQVRTSAASTARAASRLARGRAK